MYVPTNGTYTYQSTPTYTRPSIYFFSAYLLSREKLVCDHGKLTASSWILTTERSRPRGTRYVAESRTVTGFTMQHALGTAYFPTSRGVQKSKHPAPAGRRLFAVDLNRRDPFVFVRHLTLFPPLFTPTSLCQLIHTNATHRKVSRVPGYNPKSLLCMYACGAPSSCLSGNALACGKQEDFDLLFFPRSVPREFYVRPWCRGVIVVGWSRNRT